MKKRVYNIMITLQIVLAIVQVLLVILYFIKGISTTPIGILGFLNSIVAIVNYAIR